MSGQEHTGGSPVNARIFPIPPVVVGLFIATGWVLGHFLPLTDRNAPASLELQIAGGIVIVCAFAIARLAIREMRRAKTSPRAGRNVSALAYGGVFRFTRNPIYLGMTLLTLGIGIATANLWLVLLAPALLLYLQERVVKREEAYLTERFGAEYLAYKARVRRWF